MSAKSYSFKVGNVECVALRDGVRQLGKEGLMGRFQVATEAEYRQAHTEIGLSLDEADDSFNVVLVKLGTDNILVDVGEGGRPTGGDLLESMRLAGIAPETVTRVIITHAHNDHVLGVITEAQAPTFPNAKYVISKNELAYWQGRMAKGVIEEHRPIMKLMEEKGLRQIEMDEQILPGLSAVPIPGHTPGQIAVLVESENEKLIQMADLLHSPIQFAHPEWSTVFDVDTRISVPTRREALGRAADENMLTMFYHLTFPGLGRVRRAEKGFSWKPLTV